MLRLIKNEQDVQRELANIDHWKLWINDSPAICNQVVDHAIRCCRDQSTGEVNHEFVEIWFWNALYFCRDDSWNKFKTGLGLLP